MKEIQKLKVFGDKFLIENGYVPYLEFPEFGLKTYKNEKFILGVDFENIHGSVGPIRNPKNCERLLEEMKKNFADYLSKKLSK